MFASKMSEIGTDIGFLPASVLNVMTRFPLETSTCDTIPSLMNAVASTSASVAFALFSRRLFLEPESYVPLHTASEARALFVIEPSLDVMNSESFVSSDTLAGKEEAVITLASLVRSLTFSGSDADVMYPESFVISEVLDGIGGISCAVIYLESLVRSEVLDGIEGISDAVM